MNDCEISEDCIVKLYFKSASIKSVTNAVNNSLKLTEKETPTQKKRRAQELTERAIVNYYRQLGHAK